MNHKIFATVFIGLLSLYPLEGYGDEVGKLDRLNSQLFAAPTAQFCQETFGFQMASVAASCCDVTGICGGAFGDSASCPAQVKQCKLVDSTLLQFVDSMTVLSHRTSATLSSISKKISKISSRIKTGNGRSQIRKLKAARKNALALFARSKLTTQAVLDQQVFICRISLVCSTPEPSPTPRPIEPQPPVEVCTDRNGSAIDCPSLPGYCERHPEACFGPPPSPTPIDEGGGVTEPGPTPNPETFCLDEAGHLGLCPNPAPCTGNLRGCIEILPTPLPVEQVCFDDVGEMMPCSFYYGEGSEGGFGEMSNPILRRPGA